MNDKNLSKSEKTKPKILNNIQSINQKLDSPKILEKNSANDISSPSMNQKFFPLKSNFFGIKSSPVNINVRSLSPAVHSPILNYYSQLSPQGNSFNFYSPKKNSSMNVNLNSNNNSKKLSPNFNFSPSAIFNANTSNKNIRSKNEEDSKTLQEKMAPYVNTENSNNFLAKNSFGLNINNFDEIKNDLDDDSDEDNNEEAFTLTINDFDENTINQNKINENENFNDNFENKNIMMDKDDKKNIDINLEHKAENTISNNQKEESLIKNIINKSEYKPFTPNNLRNNPLEMNNIYYPYNFNQNNNFNFQNNIYMGIPQNLENNNNNYNIIESPNIINNENIMNDIANTNQSQSRSFFYKGDNYQISNSKEYKKIDSRKAGEIPSITAADIVTTITSNNKVIKRIDPNTYLNESVEYLAFNILPLAQDQAGCRFLQEKIENDPKNTLKYFYNAMIPYLVTLIKDPFGNYFVQKLYPYLSEEELNNIIIQISPNIFDVGSNHHGTRAIQNLIDFLKTPALVNSFLNMIKPYTIPLLKETHGAHIINKFLSKHPECANDINKIIIDNCSLLATHKHGCCFLQKILEGPDKPLKSELIKNLINNCFVLIIDQFGNYVIQSILFLNNTKYSSDIALIISDNAPYYSKHRYSSNVIEKCFDFCGKKERDILIEKLSTPEVISELIVDDHGNYVIQKVLYYADFDKKEKILKVIRPLIPKIKNLRFGEKILNKLFYMYPKLNIKNKYDGKKDNEYQYNYPMNNYNYGNDNKKFLKKNKYNNYNNNQMYFNNRENSQNNMNNNYDKISNDINSDNNDTNDISINKNNVSHNNYYNINNNTFNININQNKERKDESEIEINNTNNNIMDDDKNIDEIKNNNNTSHEPKKKKKKKKFKKKKKSSDESNSELVNNNINY